MKKIYKNIIFISLLLISLFSIFFINYHFDVYNLRNENPYDYYLNTDRQLVNIKIKTGKNNHYEKLVMGTSCTFTLFEDIYRENEICRLVLMSLSYKEYYQILQTFIEVHPEVKTVFFPLDCHSFLFDLDDYGAIPEYDHKKHLSVHEFINVYFSFQTTFKSLQTLYDMIKNANYTEPPRPGAVVIPKNRLRPAPENTLSEQKRKNDIYYIEKIIDLLKAKDIDIVCFIPPVNYIYLQDALIPEKIEVLENVKRLVASKGVNIYDFTKKNRYNTQRLDETCLFFDIVHANNLYGNIVYKNLTKQKDDKSVYRIITKENAEAYNKLSLKELNEYKKTYKDYIDEYFTFPYGVDWLDPANRKVIPKEDIPKEITEY